MDSNNGRRKGSSGKLKRIFCTAAAGACLFAYSGTALAVSRYEVLMIGDKDKYVTELQEALHDKGYLKQNPTGYFGTDTQRAVLEFQEDKGITTDGKAGPQTRRALLGDSYSDIPSSRFDSSGGSELLGSTDDDNGDVDMEKLFSGSEGPAVEKLQNRLKELGYYKYSSITGYFGPITKDAVQRFQRDNGLTVDGIAGAKTLSKLYATTAERSYLMLGDKSSEVTKLQNRLKELKYFTGTATGYFGTITDAAVRKFQQMNSLTVDGKVGANTQAILYSDKAKPAGGGSTSYGDPDTHTSGVDKFIGIALEQEGKTYVYSTEGPNSFDCSGLVYYCLKNAGANVSRMSAASYSKYDGWGEVRDMDDIKKGDLLFFSSSSSSSVSHVGIYIGSGKMIHASSTNRKVIISSCTSDYWETYFVNARRVYADNKIQALQIALDAVEIEAAE